MVHARAKANDLKRAESWVKKMQDAKVSPNIVTYNSMINACARCGDGHRAEDWLKNVTCGHQSWRAYVQLTGKCKGILFFIGTIRSCGRPCSPVALQFGWLLWALAVTTWALATWALAKWVLASWAFAQWAMAVSYTHLTLPTNLRV